MLYCQVTWVGMRRRVGGKRLPPAGGLVAPSGEQKTDFRYLPDLFSMRCCQAKAVLPVGTRGTWLRAVGGLHDPSREQDAAEPSLVQPARPGVGSTFDDQGHDL